MQYFQCLFFYNVPVVFYHENNYVCVSLHYQWVLIFSASITGSIISSTILYPRVGENETLAVPPDTLQYCGINDCPNLNLTELDFLEPSDTTVCVVHWIAYNGFRFYVPNLMLGQKMYLFLVLM